MKYTESMRCFDNLASSCNGEQIVDFKDIHMDKIEDVMQIKKLEDLDTYKKMYAQKMKRR